MGGLGAEERGPEAHGLMVGDIVQRPLDSGDHCDHKTDYDARGQDGHDEPALLVPLYHPIQGHVPQRPPEEAQQPEGEGVVQLPALER